MNKPHLKHWNTTTITTPTVICGHVTISLIVLCFLQIVSLSSQLHYTDHDCDQDGPEVNRDQSALMRYASAQSFPPPTADTCVTDGNIMVLRPDYIVPDFNVTSPLFRHMEEQVDEFVVEALGVGVFEARCHSMLGFVEPVSRFVDCCPSEVGCCSVYFCGHGDPSIILCHLSPALYVLSSYIHVSLF